MDICCLAQDLPPMAKGLVGSGQDTRDITRHRVTDLSKDVHDLSFRSLGFGRIRKAKVDPSTAPQPNGAFFCRRVTDCHDQIKVNIVELIRRLRASLVVNPNLLERFDGLGMDISRRVRSGAEGLPLAAIARVDNRLGHLRSTRIARAQEKDFAFHPGRPSSRMAKPSDSASATCGPHVKRRGWTRSISKKVLNASLRAFNVALLTE